MLDDAVEHKIDRIVCARNNLSKPGIIYERNRFTQSLMATLKFLHCLTPGLVEGIESFV